MRVRWKVEDGHVGGAYFYTVVDDDELAECETDEERNRLIEEYVQEDFEQRVSWSIVERDC